MSTNDDNLMKLSINGVRRSMVAALNFHASQLHIHRDELIRRIFDNVYGKLEQQLQQITKDEQGDTQ